MGGMCVVGRWVGGAWADEALIVPTISICQYRYICMYVKIRRHQHTRVHAHTDSRQARGATPELRRVTDTTSHGLSAGRHRHSTQTTIVALVCVIDQREGGEGSSKKIIRICMYIVCIYTVYIYVCVCKDSVAPAHARTIYNINNR